MNNRNTIFIQIKVLWRELKDGMRRAQQEVRGLGGAMTALGAAAGVYLLGAVQKLVGGLVDMQRKLVNLGLELEKVKVRLQLLAGGVGAAEAYISAIQEATGGMVDQMTAAKIATSALNYEIANTPDEVAELTRKILILSGGNVELADSFMYLLSNGVTSIERLNEFGISSARVRQRMAELRDTTDDYNSEAAFMQAVLDEVDLKVNTLSDSLDTNAAKVQSAQTLWKNFWQDLAEANILYTTQSGLMDDIGEAVLRVAGLAEESGTRITNAFLIPMAAQQALTGTLNGILNGTIKAADAADTFSEAFEYALVALRAISTEESRAADETQALAAAQDQASDTTSDLAEKTERLAKSLREAHQADPFGFEDVFDAESFTTGLSDSLQGVAEVLRSDSSSDEMTDEEFAKIILGQLRRADAPPEVIWAFRKASGLATASEIAREQYMVQLVNAAARGDISVERLWSESQRVRGGGEPGTLPTSGSSRAQSGRSSVWSGSAVMPAPGKASGDTKIVLELRGDLADMIDARVENGFAAVMGSNEASSPVPSTRIHFNRRAGH